MTENKKIKVERKRVYEIPCIICPICEEQIELDSKYQQEVDCPFCNNSFEIEQ